MTSQQELFHELTFYTLAHGDSAFIHQHIVDAYAVQSADKDSKPIAVAFGLIGLYLHIVHSYTGREVQRAYMQLASRRKSWPVFDLPADRGAVTITDVLRAEAGSERDAMIEKWALSVWEVCAILHTKVAELAALELPYIKSNGR